MADTKETRLSAVRAQADRLSSLIQELPVQMWQGGSAKQWGPRQHLSHLIGSHKRTAQGYAAKDRLPRHEAATSRIHEEVKAAYLSALAKVPAGALQPNPIPPDVPEAWTCEQALAAFGSSVDTLETSLALSERDLDTLAPPHPLLGLLSAGELLHFTAYHTEHHRTGVERWKEQRVRD